MSCGNHNRKATMEKNEYPFVRLRAMEPEDLDFLYGIENDERIWNVGVTNVPYSKNLLLDYIATQSGDIFTDKQVRLMVENEDAETIGIVDLINFSPIHRRAELGIVIQNKYRGKGFASATILKVLDYCRKILRLHQIYAIVPENNENCLKMLKNVGFQESRGLDDWLFDGESYCSAYFFQYFL